MKLLEQGQGGLSTNEEGAWHWLFPVRGSAAATGRHERAWGTYLLTPDRHLHFKVDLSFFPIREEALLPAHHVCTCPLALRSRRKKILLFFQKNKPT